MTREEIIELMKECLQIDVKTTSEYVYCGGDSPVYKDSHTLILSVDGVIISEVYL